MKYQPLFWKVAQTVLTNCCRFLGFGLKDLGNSRALQPLCLGRCANCWYSLSSLPSVGLLCCVELDVKRSGSPVPVEPSHWGPNTMSKAEKSSKLPRIKWSRCLSGCALLLIVAWLSLRLNEMFPMLGVMCLVHPRCFWDCVTYDFYCASFFSLRARAVE